MKQIHLEPEIGINHSIMSSIIAESLSSILLAFISVNSPGL